MFASLILFSVVVGRYFFVYSSCIFFFLIYPVEFPTMAWLLSFFSPGVSVSQFSRTNLSSVLNVNTFFFLRELNFSKVKKKKQLRIGQLISM